ncbi:hypothetical protein T492DRAFT_1069796 [Pavlovales sp. CCMP2436]|nr:hypothetical protein T492DRAFT_1069796 [Pavlovales sp. CCMP2436]
MEAAEATATVIEFGFIDENLGAFGNSIFLSVGVVAAFTVLYEDFLPLRLGGDLIFNVLDDRIHAAFAACAGAKAERNESEAKARTRAAVSALGGAKLLELPPASLDDLVSAKSLFELLDLDGSGELSRDEVMGSGFNGLLKEYYGVAEIEQLFAASRANTPPAAGTAAGSAASQPTASTGESDGEVTELSFAQFVSAAYAVGALPDAESLRLELLRNRNSRDPGEAARRIVYSDRYDGMLATFAEWTADGGEGELVAGVDNERLRTVLAGCFAGARNKHVVSALKILYSDHAPLRMGGDLIFSLMNRVVSRSRNR